MDRPKTIAETFSVSVTTTGTALVGPNPHRKALIFSSPPTNRFTVSLSPTPSLDIGLVFHPPGPLAAGVASGSAPSAPFILTDEMVGNAIGQPWFAISATATQLVGVTEISYAP